MSDSARGQSADKGIQVSFDPSSLVELAATPIVNGMKDLLLHRKDCSTLKAMLIDTLENALAITDQCAKESRKEYATRVVALMPAMRADLIAGSRRFSTSGWRRSLRKVTGRMPPIYPFDTTQAGLETELDLVVASAIIRLEARPSSIGEVQTEEPGLAPAARSPSENIPFPVDLMPNCGCNQIHDPLTVVKRLMHCFLDVLKKHLGSSVEGARFAKLAKRIEDSLSIADQAETEIEVRQELPTSLIALISGGATFGGLAAVGALAAPEAAAVAVGAAAFLTLVTAWTNRLRTRDQAQQLKMQQNADDLQRWLIGTALCLAQLHPSKRTALLRDEAQRLVNAPTNQGITPPALANSQFSEQPVMEPVADSTAASREDARKALGALKVMLAERILPRIDERDIYSHAVLENMSSELEFLVANIPGTTGDELAIKILSLMRGSNLAQLALDS